MQLKQWSNRHLLNSQSGLASIRDLTWREFEDLLCEAFRREGYVVEHTGTDGPDGGIDIRIQKGSIRSIVQCKLWKRQQVGVAIVREMFGLLHSEKVDSAIVVTSSSFSPDASEFASWKPNAGAQRQVPNSRQDSQPKPPNLSFVIPPCPKYGGDMTKGTARKGLRAGQSFWGSRRYPDCSGIVNIREI